MKLHCLECGWTGKVGPLDRWLCGRDAKHEPVRVRAAKVPALLFALAQSGEYCTEVPIIEQSIVIGGGHGQPGNPPQTVKVAIETDHELWANWGSTALMENYVHGLFDELNNLYCDEIGVRLQLTYIGIWTNPADPWTTTTSAATRLNEFKAYWGVPPNNADVGLFLSKGQFGGSAFTGNPDLLCNKPFSFCVVGNITGSIYWPNWTRQASGLNWDFIVPAHEIGHLFGAKHTHSYCPPLDHCFTNCDSTITCSQGTLMSYCHLCPSGQNMGKIDPTFHPTSAAFMRINLADSCLAGRECW